LLEVVAIGRKNARKDPDSVSSLILFPLLASGVVDSGGKFNAGVIDTGDNGVIDNGGK
jgi:hypothetical protein